MASVTCPNCQTVAAEGTAFCPGCGNALAASGAAPAGPAATGPAATGPAATGPAATGPAPSGGYNAPPAGGGGTTQRPQIKFDPAAISHVDRLVGGGTLILFISLFLPWFRVSFSFGSASASGLSVHGFLYVTLILSLFIIGFVLAETLGLWKLPEGSGIAREQVLLGATIVNLILVLIAFLDKPGGSGVGWDWGAFVGLVAAVVAVFPLGWPLIQARRNK
jgi:hypothetical protein